MPPRLWFWFRTAASFPLLESVCSAVGGRRGYIPPPFFPTLPLKLLLPHRRRNTECQTESRGICFWLLPTACISVRFAFLFQSDAMPSAAAYWSFCRCRQSYYPPGCSRFLPAQNGCIRCGADSLSYSIRRYYSESFFPPDFCFCMISYVNS